MAEPSADDTATGIEPPPNVRSTRRVVMEVAVWLFLLGGVGVAMTVVGIVNSFECGGTVGGFGEAANARLDDACMNDRLWMVFTPVAAWVGALALRVRFVRRRRNGAARGRS